MKFGLFFELQEPKPWVEGGAHRIAKQTIDQIELADKLGFDYAWMVEHHFLEEYSHSSAPEVVLAAASQRTEQIRLGHGVMVITPKINHPARVAERISMLDLISDGRVEFGSGESSTPVELGGFDVEWNSKQAACEESLEAIIRMFAEQPFAGFQGEYVRMPPRNVLPKPLQRPHPPLWRSASRRDGIVEAAKRGTGALTLSFLGPEEAGKWVDDYYATIESEDCVPVGRSVNPNVAMTMYLMAHEDEAVARRQGLASHEFFARAVIYYYRYGRPMPGHTNLWQDLGIPDVEAGIAEPSATAGSAFDGVGTPEQIKANLRKYEEVGVDQILLICQTGRIPHDQICASLELFAREVMPEFHERDEAREKAKLTRLAPAIEKALGRRRVPVPKIEDGYRIEPPPGPRIKQ
ncbi:LLM class flavin-dependent oxidoreductase [Nocardia terpenica]|uniref:LLM class flavin-dependent oxidoreductase n=1 Tax=Nocardia terpenica TaxID=455432 RepID=A0A291RR67_9NOCA|nr:LLM class flavin-dependent oxidoreductase [Nocardia terpenica]ATL69790.1 LLM class flavin-dependent oxidoreductase [Nocardia terpenica]